jgi:hypothetical protein
MDMPVTVGSDYILAVVKVYEQEKGGIRISPEAREAFSQFLASKQREEKPVEVKEEPGVQEVPKKKVKEVPEVKILPSWIVTEDKVAEFQYQIEKKKDFLGKEVEILGSTYEAGIPLEKSDWRQKIKNREDIIQYLKTGLRYWYSNEWYGSERRKTPA